MDKRIVFMESIKLEVPGDYNSKGQLENFYKEHGQEFCFYDDSINDKNFGNVSYKLQPGEKCMVDIFIAKHRISSEYCISFLRKGKDKFFTSAPGLSLLWAIKRDKLPQGLIVSFDEKNNLWVNSDKVHGVATLKNQGSSSEFFLGIFEDSWNEGTQLIRFRKND